MNLDDKVAVITGGSRGIGLALAKELDREGMKLVLVAKSEDRLKEAICQLSGKEHEYFVCDFSDTEEVKELAKKIKERFHQIDLLVNGAGIGIYKTIEEATVEELEQSLAIGLKATFVLIKEITPLMKESELSLILSIGSGAGVIPMAGRSVYCALKFGLRGLILSLAEEFKRTKTHFCLITLGSTFTNFGPMSIEEKKKEMESGKAYFTPEWVGEKLTEIIKEEKREVEYTLYPGDYGLGWWKPPQ